MKKLLITLATIFALTTLLASCDFISTTPPANNGGSTDNNGSTENDGNINDGGNTNPGDYETSYSEGLDFVSNGDGTCYVSGIGSCSGSASYVQFNLIIPSTSPDGDAVIGIGERAFEDCNMLMSVVIPEGVTYIESDAFFNCYNIESITIPNSLSSIGYNALACISLTEITVGENNKNYKAVDNVLYTKDGKTLIKYAAGKADTEFTVPNDVTTIYDYAFSCCHNLISVVIPNSVTRIADFAFDSSGGLTSIVIPESVTYLGSYAFNWCDKLASVVIPESITSIEAWTFVNCDSLTSVEIHKSVTKIDTAAFGYCDKLTEITVDENNEFYKSIDGNLYTKDGKTLVQYATGKADTKFVIPDGVIHVGYYALQLCNNLTSVVIPDSATDIVAYAFENCENLNSVVIGKNVKNIEWGAFQNCEKLANVYYAGSAEEWAQITIEDHYNDALLNATIHYNYVPEN